MKSQGYPKYFWVEVCRPVLKTLALFQTKIYDLPFFRPDSQNVYTLFQTLWCVTNSREAPNNVHIFFFTINVHGNTRYSKNDIPDQTGVIYILFQTKMAKSIPYFRQEMLENDTLWGGTYLYGLYMGVPPPPPPQPRTFSHHETELLCSSSTLNRYTVKPLLSGHPRDWANWPLNRGWPLIEVP